MSTQRLFFALWPDDRQRERLREVINGVAKTVEGKMVDRRSWHVTLAYLGDFDDALIPELLQKAAQVEVEPFRLSFDRLEFWPRPKIACLTALSTPPELLRLYAALSAVAQDLGVVPESRSYRPHITVVHNARSFTTERLAQRTTTEWSSFELMASRRGAGQSGYVPLNQ